MAKKLRLLSGIIMFMNTVTAYAWPVTANITFVNETASQVIQTQIPRLDSYKLYFFKNEDDKFEAPLAAIDGGQSTTAKLSYDWYNSWYGVSQYSYNYPNRSKDYGCFVTEISLGASRFFHYTNHNIIIASYRKDPAYPDDYLVCSIDPASEESDSFTVRLRLSSQDAKIEDAERYTMGGAVSYLTNTTGYDINLPIPLNPVLKLEPNNSMPQLVGDTKYPVPVVNESEKIKVINHSKYVLVAGEPLKNREKRFDNSYTQDEQPEKIQPGEEKFIVMSNADMRRFNYHIEGYSDQTGCYVSNIARHRRGVAAFRIDIDQHPIANENLYCFMTSGNTLEIYNNVDDIMNLLNQCSQIRESGGDPQECISKTYKGKTEFIKNKSTIHTPWSRFKDFPIDPVHKLNGEKSSRGVKTPWMYN